MTDAISNSLIFKIGEMIVEDPEFQDDAWTGIGLVASLNDESNGFMGYSYLDNGTYEAASPVRFGDILDVLRELKEHMRENGEGAFVQCLIHITKPDYDLRVQFEHTDTERWWPRTASPLMSEFAEMLRPTAMVTP